MPKHIYFSIVILSCVACTATKIHINVDKVVYTQDSLKSLPPICRKHRLVCGEMLVSHTNKEKYEYTKSNIHSCMMWLYFDMDDAQINDIVENRSEKEYAKLYKDLYIRCYDYIADNGDAGMVEIKKNIEKILPYIKSNMKICE